MECLTMDFMNLSAGKKARMYKLLYDRGPGNGTMLLLPIDHGIEHGPGDFIPNPAAADPEFQLRLAEEGGYSGIAFQIGLAEKYIQEYAGRVPLVLKLNGKTSIPPDDEAFPPSTPRWRTRCVWGRMQWGTRSTWVPPPRSATLNSLWK